MLTRRCWRRRPPLRKAGSRTGRITVTFVRSTIITVAHTVVSDPLTLAAQPRMASHGWCSRASEASMKNPPGPIKGELKARRKNLSKNRAGSFNADQTPAQLRKRIAELDLWLRELERNCFDYDQKIDGAKKPSKAWNRRMRCRTISQRGPAGPIEDCDE